MIKKETVDAVLLKVGKRPGGGRPGEGKWGIVEAFRPFRVVAALLITAILCIAARDWLGGVFPALLVLSGLVIFAVPGLMVSIYLSPEDDWLERLPLSLVLSAALLSVPGIIVLSNQLNIISFLSAFIAVLVLTITVVTWLARAKGRVEETSTNGERLFPLFAILLLAVAGFIAFVSLNMPMIGDDWVGMPWLWHFEFADRLMEVSPYHGVELAPNERQEFFLYLLNMGLMYFTSGLEPITFYIFLRPILVIISVFAFYSLGRSLFRSRNLAVVSTVVWVALLLSNLLTDESGYHLVVRIAQDKFYLRFVIFPVTFRLMIDYFKNYEKRYLFLFGIGCWVAGITHPMGPGLLAMAGGFFGVLHLLFTRTWKDLGRLILVGSLVLLGMVVPILQLLGAQDGVVALSLDTGVLDPNFVNRVRLATRAFRLLFFDNGAFILHPDVFWNIPTITAAVLAPYWLWRARKDVGARLVLGIFLLIILFYIPLTADLLSKVVTPWLLWRLAWAPEWGVWLALSGAAALLTLQISGLLQKGVARIQKNVKWKELNPSPWMIGAVAIILTLGLVWGFTPLYTQNAAFIEDLRIQSNLDACKEAEPVLRLLADQVDTPSIVLGSRAVNFCVPAFSPFLNVVEYRGATTLVRFSNDDRYQEGWQRILDEAYFSAASFIDDGFVEILERHNVEYILIERERLLNLQLAYLPDWFSLTAEANGYKIYAVHSENRADALVEGNTALRRGDLETAKVIFKDIANASGAEEVLARLGLAQVLINEGDIAAGVSEMKKAAELNPENGVIQAWLGATLIAAGRLDDAVKAYAQASNLMPDSTEMMVSLANAYTGLGQMDEARELMEKAAALDAPVDSAQYHRILGRYFANSGFSVAAVDEYAAAFEIVPSDRDIFFSIAQVYGSLDDPENARATWTRALEFFPWSAEPRVGLGEILIAEENYESALPLLLDAVRFDPANELAQGALAQVINLTEGPDAAIQFIQAGLGYELDLPSSLTSIAQIHEENENLDFAIPLYEKALTGDPIRMVNYIQKIAGAYFRATQDDLAVENYRRMETLGGAPIVVHLGLGNVYQQEGAFDFALGQFYEAVRSNPFAAPPHLSLGKLHSVMGDDEAALARYQLAIAISPNSYNNYIALADGHRNLQQYTEAFRFYRHAVSLQPASLQGYLKIAETFQILEHFDSADRWLSRAAELQPDSAAVWVALGDNDVLRENTQGAKEDYQKAIALKPEESTGYIALSDIYFAEGNLDRVEEILLSAVAKTADSFLPYEKLAQLEQRKGNFDEAIVWLERGIEQNPDSASGYSSLGDVYLRLGDVATAEANYKTALGLEVNLLASYLQLEDLFISRNQFGDAERLYVNALTSAKDPSLLNALLGNLYVKWGKLDEASAAYEEAIRIDPTNLGGYIGTSNILKRRGNVREAAEFMESVVRLFPESSNAVILLGDYYLQIGDVDQAVQAYETAVQINPETITPYEKLAILNLTLGQTDEGRQILEEGVAQNPLSPESYIALGAYLTRLDDFDAAEEAYQRAIELDRFNVLPYQELGNFYVGEEFFSEALDVFNQAIEVDPNATSILIEIGKVHQEIGDFDQAETYFNLVLEKNPDEPAGYLALSGLYQEIYDFERAVAQGEIAQQNYPYNPSVRLALGTLYEKVGRYREAEVEYKAACSLNGGQNTCFIALGQLYVLERKWSDAILAFEKAIQIDPLEWSAYLELADLYGNLGWAAEVNRTYDRAFAKIYYQPVIFLHRAEYYKGQLDWERARMDHQAAWDFDRELQENGIQYAGYLSERGEWENALAVYEELLTYASVESSTFTALGSLYSSRGMWEKALENYDIATQLDETLLAPYVSRAQIYLIQNQPEKVMPEYQRAIEVSKEKPRALLALGDYYLSLLSYQDAQAAYASSLEENEDNIENVMTLVRFNSIPNPRINVLAELEKLAAEEPSAFLYSRLGTQYEEMGNLPRAQTFYEKAVELEPENWNYWFILGSFHRTLQDLEKAERMFRTALLYQPDSIWALLSIGDIRARFGDYSGAERYFLQGIDADPTRINGYIFLANFYLSIEDEPRAVEAILTGIENVPARPEGYYTLASIYTAKEEYQTARQIYFNALEIMPGANTVYTNLGDLALTEYNAVKAKRDLAYAAYLRAEFRFDLVIGVLRSRNPVYKEREQALYDAKSKYEAADRDFELAVLKLAEAENYYQTALEIAPSDQAALLGLGLIAGSQYNIELALEYFERAIAVNPSSSQALTALGSLYVGIEDPGSAVSNFESVLLTSPYSSGSHTSISNALSLFDPSQYSASLAAQSMEHSLFRLIALAGKARHLAEQAVTP